MRRRPSTLSVENAKLKARIVALEPERQRIIWCAR